MNKLDLPCNVRKVLVQLFPISVLNEITCFSFYDNHPLDNKSIDVVCCTIRGEIQEFYNREIISSFMIENAGILSDIKLIRNKKVKLYYLVRTKDDLIIFSRMEKISLLYRINNVAKYDIEDPECKGEPYLKIARKDDAVPLIFDENTEKLQEFYFKPTDSKVNHSVPLLLNLERKLIEANYCVKCNENKYKEYLNLCQEAAFKLYEKTSTNYEDSELSLNTKKISNFLKIETKQPVVRLCNKKIAIILSIMNRNVFCMENVCVMLHCSAKQSITYHTKFFKESSECPYWTEIGIHVVNAKQEMSIVTVIDLDEIQNCTTSAVEFDIVLSYDKEDKSYLLPFKKVVISAMEILGNNFDILSSANCDCHEIMLCILSTSEKTQLCIRNLNNPGENTEKPLKIFCEYLKMDMLPSLQNVAIHKFSPYHVLHGVMVVLLSVKNHIHNVLIYSRFSSQVLGLIKYINDIVPYRVVITTSDYKISSLDKTLLEFDELKEDTIDTDANEPNVKQLCLSVLKQASVTKEYLDNCMIKMSGSKNVEIQRKIGQQIDLVSQGLPKYLEFRNQIQGEIQNNILNGELECVNEDIECMVIDS